MQSQEKNSQISEGDIVKTITDGNYKIILYRYFEGYMCQHIFEYIDLRSERYFPQDDLKLIANSSDFDSDQERIDYVRVLKQLQK